MRIEIHTKANPDKLLSTIVKEIKEKKIKTWSIVNANSSEYFTHNPEQWLKKALLKPSLGTLPNRLILTVNWYENSVPDEYTKGLYIGRFTEELLEHYKEDFTKLETFA